MSCRSGSPGRFIPGDPSHQPMSDKVLFYLDKVNVSGLIPKPRSIAHTSCNLAFTNTLS